MSESVTKMETLLGCVRPALESDASSIVEVQYRTWLATYPKVAEGVTEAMVRQRFENEKLPLEERVELCRQRIENPTMNRRQFVHEDTATGRVDGFAIAGDSDDSKRKQILAMYVLPESQGSGAGSQLMQAALRYIEASKNETILHVVSTNQQAISFYEKFGFMKTRDLTYEEAAPDDGSFYMPHTEMVRPPMAV
jgi:ribosomal protein S18 acetylase RimI-like enzyme